MTKLEELIAELCSDGVEYKKLERMGKFTRGKRFVRSDVVDSGIPAIHYGDIYTSYGVWADTAHININETLAHKMRFAKKNDVVVVGAGENDMDIGIAVAWLGEEKVAIHDACYIFEHSMNSKYISYYMRSSMYHLQIKKYVSTGKICAISAKGIGQALIPVPPLEVQREIVSILDNFTELTAELTVELTAELTARKKQYEYYRSEILRSSKLAETKTLGEVCDFVRGPFGGSLKKEIFTRDGYAVYEQQHAIYGEFKFRYFVDEQKFKEMKRFQVKPGDLIMSCSGTMGKIAIIPDDAPEGIINQALLKLTPKEGVDNRFLKYCFEDSIAAQMNSNARGGAIKNVASVAVLKDIEIQIPSIDEQLRVVALLDRFDTLFNDITTGLPAEIDARQKQYEYYRDKLLTFKELS